MMVFINKEKNCNAFTLVELMIAIAILGILAAIAMNIYTPYVNSAKCSPVEVSVHDTMLALVRALADSGSAPSSAGFANSHTIGGETLTYPADIQVSYSGNGTQANPFIVNGKRSNPVCNKGDGVYSLTQTQTTGIW